MSMMMIHLIVCFNLIIILVIQTVSMRFLLVHRIVMFSKTYSTCRWSADCLLLTAFPAHLHYWLITIHHFTHHLMIVVLKLLLLIIITIFVFVWFLLVIFIILLLFIVFIVSVSKFVKFESLSVLLPHIVNLCQTT